MSSESDVEFVRWIPCKTRVIDLSIIAENDADCYKTMISEVPFSTQLSIVESEEQDLKDQARKGISLRENLLQITIADRIIIYDLGLENPQEISFFNATNLFIKAEMYVDPGIKISQCVEDPSPEKDGFLFS